MNAACVIVAAGQGSRLGGVNKALLPVGETSFLASIADCLRVAGCARIVVVSAVPHAEDTEAEALRLGLEVVRNPEPELGMASSVSVGFRYAVAHFPEVAAFLWPVDAPGVLPGTIEALLVAGDAETIATPSFAGRGGHPSLVGRNIWPELVDCVREPDGARSVIRASASRRRFVNVDDAAVVRDIDLPADVAALEGP